MIPARTAIPADHPPPDGLFGSPAGLWCHQVEALDAIMGGESVVITTGTASGKSRCYQLPILGAATAKPRGTSLMIYPTKALAHDQLRALTLLGDEPLGLGEDAGHRFDAQRVTAAPVCAAFDGDCGPEERSWVRRHAHIVLTNPEMVHLSMLPDHRRWAAFWQQLRFVVVDELHVYRGIFGAHLSHVLRRLRRVAAHYGSDPSFVCTSATIGQPGTLAEAVIGGPVRVVDHDGSPRSARHLAVWNPYGDPDPLHQGSTTGDSARLAAELIRAGYRTVVFTRSRRSTEVITRHLHQLLPADLAERTRAYRGGYLPSERRELEETLFSGALLGVVSTSALELGVDIGGLDAAVLAGFPGTFASFRQRLGRAGRSDQPSIAVLVAGLDQLDQWITRHPTSLVERPPERVVVNPDNPHVLFPHLACAAAELPLCPADERWWGDQLDAGIHQLTLDGRLRISRTTDGAPRAFWMGRERPSGSISLRSGGGGEYRIEDTAGRPLASVDEGRVWDVVHPGAVYLHQGSAWEVTVLDPLERRAIVRPADGTTYTLTRATSTVTILHVDRRDTFGRGAIGLGDVEVWSQTTGFQIRDAATHQVLGIRELDAPPRQLTTRAFWFELPEDATSVVPPALLGGGLHAAEHATIGMLPLFAVCDRWDVGGLSTPAHPDLATAAVLIHEAYPGGAGISELGHEVAADLLTAARESIEGCGCAAGCPSCVQSPKCGNLNEPLDKGAAVALILALMATPA